MVSKIGIVVVLRTSLSRVFLSLNMLQIMLMIDIIVNKIFVS